MRKLIKLHAGEGGRHATLANDAFTVVADEEPVPATGGVILSMERFKTEGARLLDEGRLVGVLVQPEEAIEDLAYDLPRLSVVALSFPKFRNGAHYSAARLLRERYHYTGEIRAVGEVLREQAYHMIRCGFDAFAPADDASPEEWLAAASRFRHVYQYATDDRAPAFVERNG